MRDGEICTIVLMISTSIESDPILDDCAVYQVEKSGFDKSD